METRQLETAQKTFNLRKANELEMISDEGKAEKHKVEKLQNENTTLEQDTANKRLRQIDIESQVFAAQNTIAVLENIEGDYGSTPAYLDLAKKRLDIETVINELKMGNAGEIEAAHQELQAIEGKIGVAESTLAQIQQRENGLKRINELGAEEKMLAKEYEKLESELYLCETFVKTKVGLLESKINSKFSMARFKLFNILVNGGIEDACETMYLGVPFSSLNHGSQINIGLDILKTLQEFYGFHCPVWIDRRESVTKLIPMTCQIISLIVSPNDPVLRVEKA